jgi:hypothetical protein
MQVLFHVACRQHYRVTFANVNTAYVSSFKEIAMGGRALMKSVCVKLPKVAKASRGGIIVVQNLRHFCQKTSPMEMSLNRECS